MHRARQLLVHTVKSAWDNRILGLSAETAFWQLLSLPSLFLALLATLGYISRWAGADTVDRARNELLEAFSRAFSPEVVNDLIAPTVNDVLTQGRAEVISIGFVTALWAGSSATATFVNTVTIAYGMRDQRGAVRSRLLALWIYIASVLFGVILLPVLVLGPQALTDLFPKGEPRRVAGALISDAYWPAAVILLLLALASFYRLAPPRRLPWVRGVPGALLALAVFLGGSAGLRAYVTFIVAHGYTYGRLAAPIAALLFFYVLALGVLLGAEFNAAIEHVWPTEDRRSAGRWKKLPDAEPQPEAPMPPEPETAPPQTPSVMGPSADLNGAAQLAESPPRGRDS
jgi:membrane protein